MEKIEVAVSGATEAMLRRHPCVQRGGTLAQAAAEVLADDARRELIGSLPNYLQRHEAELLASVEDGDAALSEAV